MTIATPSPADGSLAPEQPLAFHADALRTLADLTETVGSPGLNLTVVPAGRAYPEITIQVPEHLGTQAERTDMVTRLAAATGGNAARNQGRGITRTWIRANGEANGHSVHIFSRVSENPS